tara:strand:+ start:96 stop:1703 length:1608 start_codon:yes stop_codon:yes gene_type:complete
MAPNNKQRQIKEIVKCGKDPSHFFNKYVKIQHPTRGTIPFKTYKFQDSCVKDFNEHRFNVIVKSRQLGLSTLTAAYAVWLAIFYKDKNILVIATKLAVAMNFIKKVKTAIRSLPPWLVLPEIVTNNKQSIEFSNGSQIKAIPTSEDAGRSEALTLLIVDEAAFVRNFDELWMGLYPTLSTGGRAIVLSTPNGVGGQYYDLYQKAESGENEFNPIKLPWDVHPERNDDWFENECKNMDEKQVAQELMCDFAASGETFLSIDEIKYLSYCIKSPMEKWGPENNVWVWKYSLGDHKYIISADVSRGDSKDYSAFHVIDTNTSEIVCEFKGKIPPDQFAVLLVEAGKRYNKALICPESNTYGYAVLVRLQDLNYDNIYFKKEKDKYEVLYGNGSIGKAGFSTQGNNRAQILTKLEQVIRNKEIQVYSSRLYEEMKTFIWKGNKAQAMRDKNDDLVMSLAIGVWLYDTSSRSQQSVDINATMLAAMGVHKNNPPAELDPNLRDFSRINPFKPVVMDSVPTGDKDEKSPHPVFGNMDWLLK